MSVGGERRLPKPLISENHELLRSKARSSQTMPVFGL